MDELAQLAQELARRGPLPVERLDPPQPLEHARRRAAARTRRRACSSGWSGSRRSTGSGPRRAEFLGELRELVHEAEAWARAGERSPRDIGKLREEGRRNELTRTEQAAYMAVARLLQRPNFFGSPVPEKGPDTTRVLAFANQKGGVAKTTTTLNLGVALRETGLRVLCIDLDPQGNLTMSQGLNPDVIERSMFDVLVHRMPIDQVIEKREIDIAVASIDLAGAELALSSQIGRERALEKALAPIKDRYDFILIDTPPSLGLLTINAFTAATGVIVPVQTEYLSLRGLVQLENTLQMVREHLNPNVSIIGILPTMYDKRLTHSREADEILRENFGDLVFNTRIRKTIRYAEAPVTGSSVLAYEPEGEAAELYRDLAKEVLRGEKSRQDA